MHNHNVRHKLDTPCIFVCNFHFDIQQKNWSLVSAYHTSKWCYMFCQKICYMAIAVRILPCLHNITYKLQRHTQHCIIRLFWHLSKSYSIYFYPVSKVILPSKDLYGKHLYFHSISILIVFVKNIEVMNRSLNSELFWWLNLT